MVQTFWIKKYIYLLKYENYGKLRVAKSIKKTQKETGIDISATTKNILNAC